MAAPLTVFGGAPSAHAQVPDLACSGSETVTYLPAVTLVPQLIHISGVQTLGTPMSCASSVDPPITSGSRTYEFDQVKSCLSLTDAAGPTFTWQWSNGQTSTMQVNFVNNTVGAQVISTGTGSVTAGTFSGDAVTMVLTGPTADALDCAFSGVTNRTGVVQLTLT